MLIGKILSPRTGQKRRWRAAVALALLCGLSGLAACNPVDTWRDLTGASKNDPNPETTPNTQNLAAGEASAYPNLATVPPPPTRAMTEAEREKLTQSLIADRANAKYTDEKLRAGFSAISAPVPPPPPPPAPPTNEPAAQPADKNAKPPAAPDATGGQANAAPTQGPRKAGEPPEPGPKESSLEPPQVRSTPEPETVRAPPPPPRQVTMPAATTPTGAPSGSAHLPAPPAPAPLPAAVDTAKYQPPPPPPMLARPASRPRGGSQRREAPFPRRQRRNRRVQIRRPVDRSRRWRRAGHRQDGCRLSP